MGKRILVVLLIMIVCVTTLPSFSVSAADGDITSEAYNQMVKEYANRIFEKYHVMVTYPIRSDGYAAVGTATLATLDTTLGYLSPSFVQQLSAYYLKEYGQRLLVEYAYLPPEQSKRDAVALGFFSSSESKIQLFIPTNGVSMTMTGNSPFTILHEMGHAYYLFLTNLQGKTKVKNSWIPFNGTINYRVEPQRNPDRNTFVSLYAASSLEEDFAETFAYAFGCNRTGLGISARFKRKNGSTTGLGKKVDYLESSLPLVLKRNDEALANLARMRKVGAETTFEGVTLSGNSLEYMGFNQPSGILEDVLRSLKIVPTTANWRWEIGGWKVTDAKGGVYLVFPGSGYVTLQIPGGNVA